MKLFKNEDSYKTDINNQITEFGKLQSINNSKEFNDYFDLLTKTVAQKMIWTFTGDNIKDFNDFLKVRGEIMAYLYPIQEIRGATNMIQALKKQLDEYYNQEQY